jgi:virginiamycin A acetyltransferase
MYSVTAREIFRRFHAVEVGMYTLGPCEEDPERFMTGTIIGRYSSIYWTARAVPDEGVVGSRSLMIDSAPGEHRCGMTVPVKLTIGHDVFVGHNVIITPSAQQIGDGAFIGAGSVVRAPVPPYAVVTGNPARVVRYRFSEGTIEELLESKWWHKSLEELQAELHSFQTPLEGYAAESRPPKLVQGRPF